MPRRKIRIAKRELTLDARPDRLDLRDFEFRPPVGSLPPQWPSDEAIQQLLPSYRAAKLVLDQGQEGACTGFGLACVVNFLLWERSGYKLSAADRVSTRMLYHLARFYDEWPGEDYDGSSCRGALKGWQRHGVCTDVLWPYRDKAGRDRFIRPEDGWDLDALQRPLGIYYRIDKRSVVDMQAAIFHSHAIYCSADVHDGWDLPAAGAASTRIRLPLIKRRSKLSGGHAFALVGYNDTGFIVQNSWGEDWGAHGFALLSYEDWVANGTDAWVVGLGVPTKPTAAATTTARRRHFVAAGSSRGTGADSRAEKKGLWSTETAYWHALVTGNDGAVINCIPHLRDAADNVAFIAKEQPAAWHQQQGTEAVLKLAVYAHGGLNSEADSIERIRYLGPAFKDNGIYPIFPTWKTGPLETIGNIVEDQLNKWFGAAAAGDAGDAKDADARDRLIEALTMLPGTALWQQMRENAFRSRDTGRGLDMLAAQLAELNKALAGKLEIHLVGHSAGSFLCGGLLGELRERKIGVASCTLFAPACDLDFANTTFRVAIERKHLSRDAFRIYVLSDDNERRDTVGPYKKSLLYLVSRAFDRWRKTPLLGMASSYDAAVPTGDWHHATEGHIQAWRNFFWAGKIPHGAAAVARDGAAANLSVLSDRQVSTGPQRIPSSHGCFDNSLAIVSETLRTIRGGELARKLTDLDY